MIRLVIKFNNLLDIYFFGDKVIFILENYSMYKKILMDVLEKVIGVIKI